MAILYSPCIEHPIEMTRSRFDFLVPIDASVDVTDARNATDY
jgi:hypothetical protein